jgi:glutaredoxin
MSASWRRAVLGAALLASLFVPFAGEAPAATLYKSVGPDGRVTYSDQPPPEGTVQKTLSFAELPSSPLPEAVLRYREGLEKGVQKRLTEAARARAATLQLFTAPWCGYCRQARAHLAEKGVAFQELDVETAEGQRAYAALGGGSGVPVLAWKGERLQGYSRASYEAFFQRMSR